MKIVSWNINGIRAATKKGFLDYVKNESPDIIGVQEIKAKVDQLSDNILNIEGYSSYFNPAERPGYSGTAVYSKISPKNLKKGFDIDRFDNEGRIMELEFENFTLFNIYFPNGKMNRERLKYKLDFYDAALKRFLELSLQGKNLIIMGDYNTAHKEIDLTHPKQNENTSGFLRIERDWLDSLTDKGFVDAFRHFNKEPENYTWWSMRTKARDRNVGWRIDYAFVNQDFMPEIKSCYHQTEIMGSDHCPVVIELL